MARAATRGKLRILCYHGLWITPGVRFGRCTFIEPAQFESRMARLKRSGLAVLPLGEAVERLANDELDEAAVVITIDDGWVSTFTHMLPVLEALELPATLYSTTWYSDHRLPVVNVAIDYLRTAAGRMDMDPPTHAAEIDALPFDQRLAALRHFGASLGVAEDWLELRQFEMMTPAELAEAHRRGLDIQLHTHRHIDVSTEFESLPREIAENREALQSAIGDLRFDHFCYPSGTFAPEAPALLARSGIRSATLTVSGLNDPGADPLTLKRLLDGRDVSDAHFDGYLSGVHHFLSSARNALTGRA